MSCQDKFARLINKAGNGAPTIPVSADHQNGDWLETDIYEGEFYENLDTGMVYYRSDLGIITVYDPALPTGENIYNSDGTISVNRQVRFSDIGDPALGTLIFDATATGSVVVPDPGDGLTAITDDAVGVRAAAQGSGIGLFGVANTGEAARLVSGSGNAMTAISNSGRAIQAESQTDMGSAIAGRLLVHMFGDGVTLDESAVLQAQSTTKGFLPPVMTTVQRNAIISPADGLYVYDSTASSPFVFDGTNWNQNYVGPARDVYKAVISQALTAAPVIEAELQNTLGITVVPSYILTGAYQLAGLSGNGARTMEVTLTGLGGDQTFSSKPTSANTVSLNTFVSGVAADDVLLYEPSTYPRNFCILTIRFY